MPLQLEIVTPERLAYSDTVDSVVLPGSEGEMGILPHHAPLLATLGVGELRIRKGGEEEFFAIAGGFVQVRPDKVVVMAETADMASEIDLEKAQEARREAERALESDGVLAHALHQSLSQNVVRCPAPVEQDSGTFLNLLLQPVIKIVVHLLHEFVVGKFGKDDLVIVGHVFSSMLPRDDVAGQ